MLDRENRLTSSAEFARATRRGVRAGSTRLVVHLAVREEPGLPPQAGFVVGKAVGNAVVRNKVKRRLRPLVRERLEQLPASATLVVRALPAAAGSDNGALGADLDRALGRVLAQQAGSRS